MKRFSAFIKSLYEETVVNKDELIHPVARRGIEKAKAKGSLDVYIPDPDDLTKEKLIGTMRPGESDYDFSERIYRETGKGFNNIRGYRGRNYSQEYFDDLDRFDKQGDPRVYDQTTGSTRGEMEAGRQEQERDEKNIGAWWDQGGGSNNPSVQGWRTTGFERAAASRAKNREQDQHFDNVERSMAGEVGPAQKVKDSLPWSFVTSMSNAAKASGVKGPDLERITSAERRKKSIEIMRSARQEEQQRRNEKLKQERNDREQAQKEQDARHEEMRKRAEERSKPIARPSGGREEPPPSGQTALRV